MNSAHTLRAGIVALWVRRVNLPLTPIYRVKRGGDLRQATGVGLPAVADAVDGADKGLLGVQRLQLTPQVFDMAVDRSVGHHPIVIIQMIEQLLAGENLARLLRQGFQQTKLGRSQIQQLIAP